MNDLVNMVEKDDNGTFTTSRLVAERFGKRHDNVLRRIEKFPSDGFTRLNFEASEYVDESGKTSKEYRITRDGFSMLAMGFTGENAYKWKVSFIGAFNKMERHLRNATRKDWIEHRAEAALEYKAMSSTLQEVRKLVGKETKFFHYANEAKLVNWALTGKFAKVDRAALNEVSLKLLAELEVYNAVLLGAGHDRETRKALLANRANEVKSLT